jgi:ferredoxin
MTVKIEDEFYTVRFDEESNLPPVPLKRGEVLSEHLDIENSPLLFGCRTGICGTCLCEVKSVGRGSLEPPSSDEKEVLALFCPDNSSARLACQIRITGDLSIRTLEMG